jgi:preprotein translocase SecF subunit
VYDIIGKRNWFFALSLVVVIPGLIFILLGPITGGKIGLQYSIDFTGGTVWTIKFQDPNVTPDQVEAVISQQGYEAQVTEVGKGTAGQGFMEIRTKSPALAAPAPSPTPLPTAAPSSSAGASAGASAAASASAGASAAPSTSAVPSASASAAPSGSVAPSASAVPSASIAPSPSPAPSASAAPSSSAAAAAGAASPGASGAPSPAPSPSATVAVCDTLPAGGQLQSLCKALEASLGPISTQASLSAVGAVVSSDLITQALVLILAGSIGILLWITYRFRDFRMGVTALVALLHDVIVVVGMFAIFGTFFAVQIDSLFVTAMLTVIGFSVHDTIVVYDRIRENRARHAGEPFERIVNHSILQTLGRSITTSFTVVITLLALLLFAGAAIGTFVLALLIGIISGTYSSIFNASPLLVVWHNRDEKQRLEADKAARPSRRATT